MPKIIAPKPIKKLLRWNFTKEELLVIGQYLAEKNGELAEVEKDKKRVTADFGAKIASLESEVSLAANKIQSGYEYRDLPCTVHFNDPKAGRKTIIRDDNGITVIEEDMTPDELQMELVPDEVK